MGSRLHLFAGGAVATGFEVDLGMSLAEQTLRQRESDFAFADPVRTGKQQGVPQPTAARGVTKHRDLVGMADNGMPRGHHDLRLDRESDC